MLSAWTPPGERFSGGGGKLYKFLYATTIIDIPYVLIFKKWSEIQTK